VLHGYGVVEPGIDSVKHYYYGFWRAIPDARVAAEDIIETPDKVVVRFSLTGTHRGRFLGIDGTGKAIQLTGMTILRFQEQRCVGALERHRFTCAGHSTWSLFSAEISLPCFPREDIRTGSGTAICAMRRGIADAGRISKCSAVTHVL
jgi:hypothetical protein